MSGEWLERLMFQHTATRRWLLIHNKKGALICGFQHTATRRWLPQPFTPWRTLTKFQHTATRRWLPLTQFCFLSILEVSTHSHPKVAAKARLISSNAKSVSTHSHPKVAAAQFHQVGLVDCRFNTQPPEGGCFHEIDRPKENKLVSTHSHPKVAAYV